MSFRSASSLLNKPPQKMSSSFRHGKDITPAAKKVSLPPLQKMLKQEIVADLCETQEIAPPTLEELNEKMVGLPSEKMDEDSEEDSEDIEVESEDDEECFREHCKELLKEHGIATVQAWFDVEKRKFQQKQKQSPEKKRKTK